MKTTKFISGACLLLFVGCVSQQEITSLDNRISELELHNAEVRKSSAALKSGLQSRTQHEEKLRQQAASLRARMEAFDEELRILTGRLEELEYQFKQRQERDSANVKARQQELSHLSESTQANEQRIAKLEQYLNLEPSGKTPATPKSVAKIKAGKQTPPPLSEDEIYRMAKQAFDQGDADTAKKKFKELIERYPKSERADNAQFWIGEIYYREKWYEKAILEYQKVIENYPKGNKVPASLLKQGLAFKNLGDKANARLILEELIRKYPKTSEAKIARDKLKNLK
jgi:tol-pal system protein YbgF